MNSYLSVCFAEPVTDVLGSKAFVGKDKTAPACEELATPQESKISAKFPFGEVSHVLLFAIGDDTPIRVRVLGT
jgi:hypothetical protein